MKKLYFIVGSQDLYGEECLKQVAEDSRQMVAFLNEKVGDLAEIELLPTVETSEICIQDMRKASNVFHRIQPFESGRFYLLHRRPAGKPG